ncbi:unnamed protein product [Owenia fusiformis]|uniref:Uncharacterized protein n=1 Tax=Owenia fusiformis TaxID=6347 RepID=A0A8S4NMS5_OWEFU|nr:unnamed protein product [Owenia fusiformis]
MTRVDTDAKLQISRSKHSSGADRIFEVEQFKYQAVKMSMDCMCECISAPLWLVVRIVLYVLSAILGLTAAVAMAIASGAFYQKTLYPNGVCILYGQTTVIGKWENVPLFQFDESSNATCNFIIAINSIATIALPLILGIILLIIIIRRKMIVDMMQTKMVSLGMLIFSCIVLLFAFISGVIATSGYNAWCSSLVESSKPTMRQTIEEVAEKSGTYLSEDDITSALNSMTCNDIHLKMKSELTMSFADAHDVNYTKPMNSLVAASWVLVGVWGVICIIELLALRVNVRRARSPTFKNTDNPNM